MAVHVSEQSSDYVSKILSERRKAKKPLMEKLRRARINDSLNELKSLVLDALNKDVSRYSKMEKADILEMTVQYMRDLKREESKPQGQARIAEYRAGFNHCAAEINRNLSSVEGADQLRSKLLSHLAQSCCQGDTTSTPASSNKVGAASPVMRDDTTALSSLAPIWIPYPSPPPSPVYVSPCRSPALSPRSPTDSTPFAIGLPVLPVTAPVLTKEIKQTVQSKKPQVWRPW